MFADLPATPTSLAITQTYPPSAMSITWAAPTDVGGGSGVALPSGFVLSYHLDRVTSASGSTSAQLYTNIQLLNFDFTNITIGQIFYFKVRTCVSTIGCSSYSSVLSQLAMSS